MPHDFLVATFEAYGIDKAGLDLINNYLSNLAQQAN